MTTAEIIDTLRALATDLRRERPIDWTPEEADERTAARLEALAKRIADAEGAR